MAEEPPDTDRPRPGELPQKVITRAERLTRLSRRAVDENEIEAYRTERGQLLADYGYAARIRSDDTGDVLVLHPDEWLDEDGIARVNDIEDTGRAVERSLEGPGDPDDWDEVAAHNEAIAEVVGDDYGEVHGANAETFAIFLSNHYAKRIESVTPGEIEEFRTDYYVRNAWPSEEQRTVLDESLEKIFDVADVPDPRSDV
jgi:hypothetical protein